MVQMETLFLLVVCCCTSQWLVSAQTSLSDADRKELLDAHNQFRRMVSPTASNMIKLVWNNKLQDIAQEYAAKCNFRHNTDRSSSQFQNVGENLYTTTGSIDYSASVEAWYNEVTEIGYDYNNRRCIGSDPTACLHYTQVVWAETVAVGCGVYRCSSLSSTSLTNAAILVCNYGPAGNVNIATTPPYLSGEPCSECPSTHDKCDNKLCASKSQDTAATDSVSGQPGGASAVAQPHKWLYFICLLPFLLFMYARY